MIYLLFGENSYQALRKIREFKSAFSKKADSFLIEEFDGESAPLAPENFHATLGQANLFSETRLVIFRNVLGSSAKVFDILKTSGDFLKKSKDIFLFWEREPEKTALTFFKKYSEKIQEVKPLEKNALDLWLQKKAQSSGIKLSKEEREVMIEEAGEGAEWTLENELEKMALGGDVESVGKPSPAAPSPFAFIEKMFGPRALLALKEMSLVGIEPQRFIYAFLWKLKQKKMADAYFNGILAESKMRRDPKNSYEILERFIFSLK